MFNLGEPGCRSSRRQFLNIGGLSALGLTLSDWFRAPKLHANESTREPACIFIFLSGGPSHLETFDPKPGAPINIRGPFGTIPTNAPGIRISELLPQVARHMDKCTLIRSMTSQDSHSGQFMLTGNNRAQASFGAVLHQLKGATRTGLPPFVQVGYSGYLPGGGSLGGTFNPLLITDPAGQAQLPEFSLTAGVTPQRFSDRRSLLQNVDAARDAWQQIGRVSEMDLNYRRAVDVLTSDRVRSAFDLGREPDSLRERYGGSVFGQSCILARRLVEAGTRFVQVNWFSEPAWHGWDCHGADLPGLMRMESPLCPRLDQGLSALLDDLNQRGMLASTLVVVTGEFGRTPRINKDAGRDHWPQCFSVLLAGGGVPGGTIVGASDEQGAYPSVRPVTMPQFAATLYRLMGINTNLDPRIRPFIGDAAPLSEVI